MSSQRTHDPDWLYLSLLVGCGAVTTRPRTITSAIATDASSRRAVKF